MALEDLSNLDINGIFCGDSCPDSSGFSVGVLLVVYSIALEGCALWWQDSEDDLNPHVQSSSAFFNSFYY